MKTVSFTLAVLLLLASCCGRGDENVLYNDTLPEVVPGYVGLQGGRFVLDGEEWFPMMLNYKAFIALEGDSLEVVPAHYYRVGTLREHFDTIASWGFNAVRVCLDVLDGDMDSSAMFRATRRMVERADSAGLKVMLLIKPPLEKYWQDYTKALLRSLADMPALWAYDFMNEPLYFDPQPEREKKDAEKLVNEWRHWVRLYAPHQLFTLATAEPIEVFEWDPSMLDVDFVEMHTYHPLRAASEMWWYSRYCGKPWMVGETGLPSDDDSVPYSWQAEYMFSSYTYAKKHGAIGYGWWEFADHPDGVNFEAQYTGLRDTSGRRKPAADVARILGAVCLGVGLDVDDILPSNYYNMLDYSNICLRGRVVDQNGKGVDGAVVRGWNDDWSVGMNTYTDEDGYFTLYSNDYNVHFEVSAPGMSRAKFDSYNLKYQKNGEIDEKNLPDRNREYQQIDYRDYMLVDDDGIRHIDLHFDSTDFTRYRLSSEMGDIRLSKF